MVYYFNMTTKKYYRCLQRKLKGKKVKILCSTRYCNVDESFKPLWIFMGREISRM